MFERLDKYRDELERAKKRRDELDLRIKELERKCKEEENSQIHGMVHAMNLTPEQLQKLLEQVAANGLPGAEKPKEETEIDELDEFDEDLLDELEDFDDEEN
ncbi:MAG: DUF4315 family protein [Pseudobutyrivibrio sp.]|nr:DUF4315 family protein [Pseudobutyrivibrio sp.]MCF0187186.1 DUF4315 family protein [Bacteroidaceae bacterium]